MSEFTASNGVVVKEAGAGLYVSGEQVQLDRLREKLQAGSYGDVTPAMQQALREFFQHERDEELGRWRWPENPDYVVYGHGDGARVFRESTGAFGTFERGQVFLGGCAHAAQAYFDAHPDRKPWHGATDGHLWLIRFDDFPATDVSALVKGGRFVYNDHCHEGIAELADPTIVDARRIWPES